MTKGVIFDLDGVICSTDDFHFRAWNELAKREGIYFDKEINNRLRGVSRMASLDIILERSHKEYTEAEKEEMATYKNDIYKGYLETMNPSYLANGVLSCLRELKEHGIKIAIGSSSKNTMTILERLGIKEMFDAVADGNDIKKSKPDPEVFLCAAKKLGLEPWECDVVEDAFAGIEAANRGGFTSIGIGDAYKDPNADFHIKGISEVIDILALNG